MTEQDVEDVFKRTVVLISNLYGQSLPAQDKLKASLILTDLKLKHVEKVQGSVISPKKRVDSEDKTV